MRIPPYTALVLVDHEPDEQIDAILTGYMNLRRACRDVLKADAASDAGVGPVVLARPRVVVSIHEEAGPPGARRNLENYCRSMGFVVIKAPRAAIPGPFGKNAHLIATYDHWHGEGVLVSDARLDERDARALLTHYSLGGIGSEMTGPFLLESKRDGKIRHMMLGRRLLFRSGPQLLHRDDDLFAIHRQRAFFGGLSCPRWDSNADLRRWKFRSERTPDDLLPRGHRMEFAGLVDSVLYRSWLLSAADREIRPSFGYCEGSRSEPSAGNGRTP